MAKQQGLDYAQSGVDTDLQEVGLKRLIATILPTFKSHGLGAVKLNIGQFANVIDLANGQGVCVSTDGVGSKALIATMMKKYDTIGIDCVAMNVNDIICVGARPLTLVDYIACRRPDPELLEQIGHGLAAGAREADISISGGEIAQLPDMLAEHEGGNTFDLVGTAIGIVDLEQIVVGQDLEPGDAVVGIESSGIHSNGMSLARKAFEGKFSVASIFDELDRTLGEELLKPTYIYVPEVRTLLDQKIPVKALVHITSDGFLNLTRVLSRVGYTLDQLPDPHPIFSLIQEHGKVSDGEMFFVYNMGIGFCVVVAPVDVARVLTAVTSHGKKAQVIGQVIDDPEERVFIPQRKLCGKGKRFYKMERLPSEFKSPF
ncbi:MAG: phosphoribosylformylglycinamidine cyclo-ligase [Gammaproteobacteria bacterium]